MNKFINVLNIVLMIFASIHSGRAQGVEDKLAYNIQFGNYKDAFRAVSEASANHNVQSLILGLKHPDPDIRTESANAIGLLNAQQAIPQLIEAWNKNRRPLNGGTGIQVAQANLDQALTKVLVKLTNQTLNTQRRLSDMEMKSVIENTKGWLSIRTRE